MPPAASHPLALWLLALALTSAIHAPLFFAEPTLDDPPQVFGPHAPRLSEPASYLLAPYWRETLYTNHYRPVQRFAVALDRALWSDAYAGLHLTSAALHALATLLVFVLARALLPRAGPWPLLAAGYFLVQPLHVENLAQVAARGEILVFLAAGAACLLHARALELDARGPRLARLGLCALLYLLALLTKENGLLLPGWVALFLLTRAWRETGSLPAAVRRLGPALPGFLVYLPMVPLAVGLHVFALGEFALIGARPSPLGDWSPGYRAAMVLLVNGGYLQKLVLPYPLAADYTGLLERVSPAHFALFVAATLALVAGVLLALIPGPRRALRAGGMTWVALALFPFAHVVPCTTVLSDRNAYLATAGAAFALAALGAEVSAAGPRRRRAVRALATGLLATLTLISVHHARTWQTRLGIWSATVAHYPESKGATQNLAAALWEARRYADAARVLGELLALDPANLEAAVQRAVAWHALGRRDEARRELRALADAQPERPEPLRALGRVLIIEGREDEGEAAWQAALARAPGDPPTARLLLPRLLQAGARAEAAALVEAALQRAPHDPTFRAAAARLRERP